VGITERRIQVFQQLIDLFPAGRLVDLGAGHGQFSIAATNLGWEVTAVDARSERWPDDPRITWIEQDVRRHELSPYDVVACLGLFYHLTLEDQLDFLARVKAPLIIDTHLDHGLHEHPLSDPVRFGDYEGRLYREPGITTSSWGNPESFWPTLDSFHRMLGEHGYQTVLTVEPWIISDRTFFLALR
jgi:hypothetical protein